MMDNIGSGTFRTISFEWRTNMERCVRIESAAAAGGGGICFFVVSVLSKMLPKMENFDIVPKKL